MIIADITNKGKDIKIVLPMEDEAIYAALHSVGVRLHLRNIQAGKVKGNVSLHFSAVDSLGNHLLALFPDHVSLKEVNSVVKAIVNTHDYIKPQLEDNLIYDRYRTLDEVTEDLHEMKNEASNSHETYYFPLSGKLWDEKIGWTTIASEQRLVDNKDKIEAAFLNYLDGKDMTVYYNGTGSDTLFLIEWVFFIIDKKLYGTVEVCNLNSCMEIDADQALRAWICAQNRDGIGEGFEQQEILLDDGTELYVSFWHSGPEYFVKDELDLDDYLDALDQQPGDMW